MEGRVEVCRGGVWGAVYDSTGWNFNDGQVTCRQLGYPSECEFKTVQIVYVMYKYLSSTLVSQICSSFFLSFCNYL